MKKQFYQEPPQIESEYIPFLQDLLKHKLPQNEFREFDAELKKFAVHVVREIHDYHEDSLKNLPQHRPFAPWGERVDDIEVSEGWQKLQDVSATEGLVAIAYERKFGEYSRVLQLMKLFLFHPSSAFFSCPLAMTDGAARILELKAHNSELQKMYKNLTTRNPKDFWTSGQWMTEREGGSDVSNSSTTARLIRDDAYELTGDKWFSSATTSDIAFTLAKIEGSDDLSLFCLKVRNEDGKLNGITVNRLKDKMGTKALPTAELSLRQTRATLIGEKGSGVKNIATMLNITRMYNAVCSLGQMNRSLNLALNYSRKRKAFGQLIIDHPLHQQTLSNMNVHLVYGLHFVTELALLMGKEECGRATEIEKGLLRLLIPIAKLTTAKHAVMVASECIECFGGAGYVEDTGIPLQLRDAQVFSIWEGTTNILSLDVLRVIQKSPTVLESFFSEVKKNAPAKACESLGHQGARFQKIVEDLNFQVSEWMRGPRENLISQAKYLAFSIGYIYVGSLMIQNVMKNSNTKKSEAESQLVLWLNQIDALKYLISPNANLYKQTF